MNTNFINDVVEDGCGWLIVSAGVFDFFPYKTRSGRVVDVGELGAAISKESGATVYFYEVTMKPSNIVEPQDINYPEYILTPGWRVRATKAKELVGWRCQVCNRHKSEVTLDAHHRTYERLGDERPEDITVLCRDCHGLYESNKKNGRET